MSAPPYMKLFWGDYHKATRHLTRDQHGAYFLLIGEAWRLGGSLPDDDSRLAAWALCTREEWASIKPVIMDFFALRRGKWWHDRVREELASYESISRKRKEAGKRGGSASRGTASGKPEANASHLPTKPEPEPEPKEEADCVVAEAPTRSVEPWLKDQNFASAWDACTPEMRKRAKSKGAAWREWVRAIKVEDPARIAAAVRTYVRSDPDVHRTGGPGFQRWLRDRAWESCAPHAPATPAEPPSPALIAHRLQHFSKTGEWKPAWGPKPANDASDTPLIAEGKRA